MHENVRRVRSSGATKGARRACSWRAANTSSSTSSSSSTTSSSSCSSAYNSASPTPAHPHKHPRTKPRPGNVELFTSQHHNTQQYVSLFIRA
ncbi:hypothetical protein O3P69_008150 [Scylla paramamosain]|uniref:Uncharacterized protein n=1 Tax=Scylla paramamosain TaxID=85552 RepID=A0AAW0T0Q6_SCYPA